MPQVVTVREAVKRAKEEGFPISEYTVRYWIKQGAIPVRKAGRKNLLFYPNLVRYVQCQDGKDNEPDTPGVSLGIRRIEL